MNYKVFKPGVRGRRFLEIALFARKYVCVSVCVSAPEAINNQWRDMV